MSLLEVDGLTKRYVLGRRWNGRAAGHLDAVQDVSFSIGEGETLAVVGESGAGKSTVGRLVLRLIDATSGSIHFAGSDVRAFDRSGLRRFRRDAQLIFQDPYGTFDPRVCVGEAVGEPMLVHGIAGRKERWANAASLLRRVGLREEVMYRFPSELSGGQLQRAAIARVLSLRPRLVVCDEPVAALDVSVRAQVLNLLNELQGEFGLSYLFISHDLALVEIIADRVAVMNNGQIVECGQTEQVFTAPTHPYTVELLRAIPRPVPPSLRTGEPRVAAAPGVLVTADEVQGSVAR